MVITEAIVAEFAYPIIKLRVQSNVRYQVEQFKAHFGASLYIVSCLWNRLEDTDLLVLKMAPHHLLWALLFLKLYSPAHVLAISCGVTAKTYREWVWRVLEALEELSEFVVSLSINRSVGRWLSSCCVDCFSLSLVQLLVQSAHSSLLHLILILCISTD